jgi:alkylation response protein AidB-like acyl-CoA dehydrogenase
MALVLNEEQTMLRDAARDFLGARAPVSHLRELRDHNDPDGFSHELWAEMAELGWSAILVPEEHGGLGYGYTGLGLVLEETGRTLTPSPLLGTALTAVTALNLAGTPAQRAAILPGIAPANASCRWLATRPPAIAPVKLPAPPWPRPRIPPERPQDRGHRWARGGHLHRQCLTGGGLSLFRPRQMPGVTVERYPCWMPTRPQTYASDRVELGADALLGLSTRPSACSTESWTSARIGAAAELLAWRRRPHTDRGHLKQRKQFGVPIGSFQALQHRAAKLHAEIEMCKSVVLKGSAVAR